MNIMAHSPDRINDYMKRNLIDEAYEKCLDCAVSKMMENIPEEKFFRS